MAEETKLRAELRADCSRCFALCCVAPGFSASADFAISKPAGTPCPNLNDADFRCGIHDHLRASGFPGCVAFDCFGAGQKIAQVTFAGRDWRAEPDLAAPMFAAFAVMRDLHELMWYLAEAVALPPAAPLAGPLRAELEQLAELTKLDPGDLIPLDVAPHRSAAQDLLRQVGELVRTAVLDALRADRSKRRTETELTAATGLPPGALAPVLARLERAGELTREPDGPAGQAWMLTPQDRSAG
jgi:hypothetical protein